MNVNVKVSLTDEQRRKIFANFYGGKKGMISRKDVNAICQAAITDWLMDRNSGPTTDNNVEVIEEIDVDNVDVIEVMKQNELLLKRVNDQQNFIDRKLARK
jgi:hypothetical protein